ncbi:MAG: dTDP-glucose 4,6-dehydratase [Candidatus Dadabacteria bacterium]|nr:MAG: dTDP-glucose 4,6-dehydratase [Candidatus Dadabacteria bacterium]
MKTLITGAAGFIGSNFVHYLVSERPDWQVSALDVLTYAGNFENIASLVESGKVEFLKIDITDREAIEDLFKSEQFDIVFHFAAESHVDRSILGADAFVKTNVLGTQILIDAARAGKVERFMHISTDEVYGSLDSKGRFSENSPLNPSSAYSASKAGSDLLCLAAFKTHGFPVIVTRCTNNYGPYQFPEKLIPLFITNALEDRELPLYGDGMNVRSWLYVTDHCEALVKLAESGRVGEVYNIGGEEEAEVANLEVTRLILKELGKPEDLIKKVADRPGHDRRYALSCQKIREEVGWQPTISFADGLKRTIDWYLANSDWWKRIKSGEYLEYYKKNYGAREGKY